MDADFVADVRSTLRLVGRWRLSGADWDAVGVSLARLASALDQEDAATAASALEEIERLGPSRLASARSSSMEDATDRSAPPEPVLEILNMLVHPAEGWGPPG